MIKYYMHTLNGKPAYYDGERVGYGNSRTKLSLCRSLEEIRDQQIKSDLWLKKKGLCDPSWIYGYVMVRLPE